MCHNISMSTFHQIESPNLMVDGTITVLLKSGKHFTYRLSTVRKGDLEGKRIAALLTGPDNNASYKGFGFIISPEEGITDPVIKVWRKYLQSEAFMKHAQLLEGCANEHVQEWMQEGRCMKCGRKLTTPESLKAGVGPVCAGRK